MRLITAVFDTRARVAGKIIAKLPRFAGRIYTLAVVLLGWVIFRAETLSAALSYFGNMFDITNIAPGTAAALLDRLTVIIFAAALVLCTPVVQKIKEKFSDLRYGYVASDVLTLCGVAILFSLSIVFLTGSDYNPFIYFRF